jgi:ABC-type transporter Mla subunit MlaD
MPEDVFRIVVAAAVAMATLAFVVQAGVVIALYRGAKKTQEKITQFIGEAQPILAKAGPLIEDARPILARIEPTIDRIVLVIDRIGPAVDKVGPALEKIGPVANKIGQVVDNVNRVISNSNRILEENRPRIAEISIETAAMAKSGREQVERLGALLHDAGERAQTRLEQIDQTVENTVEQIEHVGDSVKRAVLRPVKEVNGLAAGISAAVSTLVHGSRKSSVDSATQDEEMFI